MTNGSPAPGNGISDVREHRMVPVPPRGGVTQVQPAGGVIDANVVDGGTGKVRTAFVPGLGPLLETVASYRIVPPAATGSGVPKSVTARSAGAPTVLELFAATGSYWSRVTVAVFVGAVPPAELTTMVTSALAPASRDPRLHARLGAAYVHGPPWLGAEET